jgi:hypothetical protein
MSEILTESFCERCGTRYTFESARPKVRLKGVKVLSLGLKNFVLSDDTTLDEAMAAARSEADRKVTAYQLDAFHKTFNFCLSCRQYTCPNCWNEVEARCLSCAPHLGDQTMPAARPGLATLAGTSVLAEPATNGANGHPHDAGEAEAVAAAESEGLALEPVAERDVLGETPVAAEPMMAAEPEAIVAELEAAAEPEAAAELPTEPARKAAQQTSGLLRRFRPAETVTEAAEPVPVEAIPVEPEPTGVMADDALPQPEAAAAADVVEQPTWRITAPDPDPSIDRPTAPADATIAPQPTIAPSSPGEPEWPDSPEWPAATASAGLPFLGRPAQPQGGVEALWAASNQELTTARPTPGRSASGIQPCVSCGLSLSATARFCRRCGTLQGS